MAISCSGRCGAVATSFDVQEHWRIWSEIEWDIIAQRSPGSNRHDSPCAANDDFAVSDLDVIGIGVGAVAAVKPIGEYPRNV